MKKRKRILALAGACLLAGLYLATLIFALIDSPWAYDLFKLCVGFTIIVPVLLYAYTMIFRLTHSGDASSGKDSAAPLEDPEGLPNGHAPANDRPEGALSGAGAAKKQTTGDRI